MQAAWQTFLTGLGAVVEQDRVQHFAQPQSELAAADHGTVLCDLSHWGLLPFAGDDVKTFLNGQLSSDVQQLGDNHNQYSSHSTPKGRMLGNFLVWQQDGRVVLQVAPDLKDALQKRLSMYILRAKVKLTPWEEAPVMLGLAGPEAASLLHTVLAAPALAEHGTWSDDGLTLLRTRGERYQLLCSVARAIALWPQLAKGATPAGEDAWLLGEIRAGIPWITAATQDAFVAQMVNLELLGGVSFRKGCYTGQEIIARTQHLGKVKQRLFRVAFDVSAHAGDALYSPDLNGQSSGTLLNVAQTASGHFEALAVLRLVSIEHGMHLHTVDGPAVRLLDLPYPLE